MGDASNSEGHRRRRAQLRHATFIEPLTGMRSKRSFSLHSPTHGQIDLSPTQEHDGEDRVLLSRPSSTSTGPLSSKSKLRQALAVISEKMRLAAAFLTSDLGTAIFKCAFAYLLGSMCTFVPFLANLLGRLDSKHTVATVTVYFHPARSAGSMLEALLFAFSALLYTAVVSLTSMGVSVLFIDVFHQVVIGHFIVLLVFVGGGLGLVGWIKLKKGDPLVNIACSLTCLSLISILTQEGAVQAGDLSFDRIGQYLKMTIAGVVATVLVSFFVFPISARVKFKDNMVTVTDSLSDLLGVITSSFISGDETELEDKDYHAISERHRKSASQLKQNLKESKYELNVLGFEREAKVHAQMVACVQRISQSIGGLRSAAAMQFDVVSESFEANSPTQSQTLPSFTSFSTSPAQTPEYRRSDHGSTEMPGLADVIPQSSDSNFVMPTAKRKFSKFRSPREIVELFIDHLGPSMRSLAFTMKEILDDLPFDPERQFAVENNPKFRLSLEQALDLYKKAREEALIKVYNKKDMERDRPMEVAADWEEAAACCGHFSFSLLEVAEQLKEYLVILDELEVEVEERPSGRTWSWLKFWSRDQTPNMGNESLGPMHVSGEDNANGLRIRALNLKAPSVTEHPVSRRRHPLLKRAVFERIYAALSFLRQEDKKFAIKVGIGAMLYAAPSYIAATRPVYAHWRGEWGLLSYMLVCSMTIGASNTTGYQRVLGTCLGASLAALAWIISDDNPFALAIFGFCMAYWTAYIIVGKGKGPMGRFIMLTYNLSALYAYTLSVTDNENDADEEDDKRNPMIWTIALHRVVAVMTGCLWGLTISRAVWPISARRKLKSGLSLLWLRMGLIWKRDPLSVFIHGESQPQYMNLTEEMELQRFVGQLNSLIAASKHEFSLRRPFPSEAYTRILTSTSRMLEAFHTMNIVILKDLHATQGETALLYATAKARAQLCSRISHQLSCLSSSMKLEYSMNTDALPDTEHTRDRLLSEIFAYRKADAADHRITTDEDYSLLYTYALVTGQIGTEIKNCFKEVEDLFGVMDEESLRLQ